MEPFFQTLAAFAVVLCLITVVVYERLLRAARFRAAEEADENDLFSSVNALLAEENMRLRAELAARRRHPAFRVLDGGAS